MTSPLSLEEMRARLKAIEDQPLELGAEEYSATQQQLVLLASLVANLPLGPFLAAIERADAVAPIFHPSLWMAGHVKLDAVRRLARAANALRCEVLQQARDELEARARVDDTHVQPAIEAEASA